MGQGWGNLGDQSLARKAQTYGVATYAIEVIDNAPSSPLSFPKAPVGLLEVGNTTGFGWGDCGNESLRRHRQLSCAVGFLARPAGFINFVDGVQQEQILHIVVYFQHRYLKPEFLGFWSSPSF